MPIFLVGYPVSREAIDRYRTLRNLPEYNNRILVQDLQSKLNAPLALVRVELDDDDRPARINPRTCWLSLYPLHSISFRN